MATVSHLHFNMFYVTAGHFSGVVPRGNLLLSNDYTKFIEKRLGGFPYVI